MRRDDVVKKGGLEYYPIAGQKARHAYVCMHACMYVFMYVCMYVCMYVFFVWTSSKWAYVSTYL